MDFIWLIYQFSIWVTTSEDGDAPGGPAASTSPKAALSTRHPGAGAGRLGHAAEAFPWASLTAGGRNPQLGGKHSMDFGAAFP